MRLVLVMSHIHVFSLLRVLKNLVLSGYGSSVVRALVMSTSIFVCTPTQVHTCISYEHIYICMVSLHFFVCPFLYADVKESSVLIEVQSTADDGKMSMAKDLSAKYSASTWAKELAQSCFFLIQQHFFHEESLALPFLGHEVIGHATRPEKGFKPKCAISDRRLAIRPSAFILDTFHG